MKRILVTGGAGFIGSSLVRHLLAAYSDAEYTDAPASDTITLLSRWAGASAFTSSPASLSVSRLAVPLPTAISSTPCCFTSLASTLRDSSQRFCGAWG